MDLSPYIDTSTKTVTKALFGIVASGTGEAVVGNGADQRDGGRAAISEATVQDARAWDRCATDAAGLLHLARSRIRVRLKIIRNELIKNVGKFQSCMFSKLRIIFKRIVVARSEICFRDIIFSRRQFRYGVL